MYKINNFKTQSNNNINNFKNKLNIINKFIEGGKEFINILFRKNVVIKLIYMVYIWS